MRVKLSRPSPAMVVALIALFAALGGNVAAYALGRNSIGARELAPMKLRSGKVLDADTTPFDGSFNYAKGHAICKRGERLLGGGLRLRAGRVFPGQNVSMVESGPVPKEREWAVTMNSDLGGAARKDFVVFAMCLAR